jgi:hypothetical protein
MKTGYDGTYTNRCEGRRSLNAKKRKEQREYRNINVEKC